MKGKENEARWLVEDACLPWAVEIDQGTNRVCVDVTPGCVCVYNIYIYIYTHIYTHTYIYIYIFIHTHMYTYTGVY